MTDYKKNVYNALKGELGDSFDKSFEEFDSLMANEEGYAQKVYGALKSELGDSFDKSEDDFMVLVKKKEDTTSPSSEEGSTSDGIVSTPDQEFLTQEAMESRAGFEPRVAEELSFKEEEEKPKENYMALFDKKDKVKAADESGVSLSFAEQVSEAASKAEYPIEFINESSYAKKRLDGIIRHFPDAHMEASDIHAQLQNANPRNIVDINEQIDALESKFKPSYANAASMRTGEVPREVNLWAEYQSNVKNDDAYFAIKRLKEDEEKLKKSATGADISVLGEVVSATPMMGAGVAGGAVTAAEAVAEGKGEDLVKGVGRGIKEYVEGYTKLREELLSNEAITELQKKMQKADSGEKVDFSSSDKLLMKALYENAQAHADLDGEIPATYKVGEAVGQSLGFMGEFLLTGGQTAVGKMAAKSTLKGISKFGAGAAVKLVEAGIQTAKMPSLYKKAAENVSNGMSTGEAFLGAAWETGAEVMSEKIFMGNPIGAATGKTATNFLKRAGINFNIDKGGVGVFKNILEEYTEEKLGEIMTAPKDYESFGEFWKGFTDEEQNKITFGSVALMTGGMGSVALSGSSIAKTRREMMLKRVAKYVPSDLKAEIDIITNNKDLSVSQQYDLIKDAITDRVGTQELGENPAEAASYAMRYAQHKVSGEISDAVDENAVVKDGELTVGEVEAVGGMQSQMDYLKGRGVDLEGLNGEQVEQLYNKEKANEDKEAIQKATGEEEQAVTETAKEAKPPTEKKVAETTEKEEEVDDKPSQIKDKVATKESVNLKEKEDGRQEVQEQKDDSKERQGVSEQESKTEQASEEERKGSEEKGEEKVIEKPEKAVEPIKPEKGATTPKTEKVAKKLSKVEKKADFDEFVKDVVSDEANLIGVRIDGLNKKQVKQAIKNIKEGKETAASKRLVEALNEAYESGSVQFDASIERGGATKTVATEEFRKSLKRSKEREQQIEDEYIERELKGQADDIAKRAGIEPKNLRDVFKAGREVFGLNKVQALAQAIITDRIVAKIAKRRKTTKASIYATIEYKKTDAIEGAKAPQGAKGAMQTLANGNTIIHALTNPDVSTPLHEIAHVYENYMTKAERDAVLRWTGDKEWNTETSEKFARGFEKYLATGVAPTAKLKHAFELFKEWLTDIYNGITNSEIDIELNDEMTRVYNAMLGEGTVKPKKVTPETKEVKKEAPIKEYKETFKDVDDLLFQDGVKYQGEDKTARHTQAVNNLIENYKKQGVEDIDKAVRDYLEERGNPVSKEIIDKALEGYKKGQPKKKEEKKEEKKEAPKDKDGKKESRFGARFFTAVSKVPQAIQDLIKQQGVHLYQPTSLEEATNVADALVEQSSLEDLQKAILEKEMNEAVWLLVGVKTMQRLDKEIYKAKKNGQERQDLVNMQLSIANAMTKKVSGAGLLLRASQTDGVTDYIAPEAWVKDYIDGVIKQRTDGEKTKWFKRSRKLFEKKVKRIVSKTVEDTMEDKTVKKAIDKAKKAKPKPKKQKSAATKKRESLLKEWQKSIDKRKGNIKYQAARAEFEWTEEDIDFAKQIVQTYVEDEIYNKAVIADKLRKQFDKMGITISDDVMEQLIPTEHNGESLDDLLEKQQLDKAAERLAGRIFGEVVEKKKKDDPIGVMVNTLLGKFREREKAPVKEKESDLDKIVKAIRNFEKYEDVWKSAKDAAIEKINAMDVDYATKKAYEEKINAAYENATKFTFTENQVRSSVRKAIKDLNIDLNDVVKSHMSVRGATMESIKEYLIDMSGLDAVEAKILAEAIDKVYRGLLTKRSKTLIAQETRRMKDKSEGKVDTKMQQTETDRLIDLILLKAFEEQEFVDAYASVKGIPKINDAHVREIERLAELVRVAPSAAVKRMRKDDLLKYVRRIDGVPLLELVDTLWFGFVLSGVATQIRNTYGAFGNVYGMLATDAIANPAMIPTILRAQKMGWKLGRKKAGVIYRTGKQFFEDRLDLPPASEMANDKAWLFKGIAHLMRHMSANDQLALSIGKESTARMMAEEQMDVNQFKKLYSKKYRDTINSAVDEMLAISTEQLAEFDRIAKEEAEEFDYDRNEQEARRQELIDEARPIDLTKEAETAAARATGNTKAYGTLGFLIHKIAEGMRGITIPITIKGKTYQTHPLKLAAVFTKISTNVATFQLSFTPVGFINALIGQYGLVKKDSPYYREMTPRENRKATVRAAVGSSIMAITWAMMDVGDDDHWLQVTANGTGNYADDEELRKDGWRPYSIIINGKPIPYRYSPFALLFAPLGYMSDHKKYVKEDKNKNEAALVAEASAGTLTYMAENTPLKGMMTALTSLIGSAATGGKNQGEKVIKVFTNMAKGFYSPAIAKNVIDTYDYVMRNDVPENNKLYQDYIDRTFFEVLPIPEDNFPAVDAWGMPREQKQPLDEFLATGGTDNFADLRAFHYEQGAGVVGMPSRKTQFFEVYFADGTMQPAHLDRSNRKFRYAWNQVYLKKRGEMMRNSVISLKASGLRGADYVMAFEEEKRVASDVAKAAVTNYFVANPMPSKYKE